MDWDKVFHAVVIAGLAIVLIMVVWCFLALLFLLTLGIGSWAYYGLVLAVWIGLSKYVYGTLDEDTSVW